MYNETVFSWCYCVFCPYTPVDFYHARGGQKTHSSFWAKSSTRGVWSLFERRQVFVRNRCENIQKGRFTAGCNITGIKSLIHWNNLYHSSQSHTGSPSHPTGLLPSGLTCFHQDQLLKCLELTHIETWQPFKPTFRWVWCYILKFPSLFTKSKNQWMNLTKSTAPGCQIVGQNSFSELWKHRAAGIVCPIDKNPECWLCWTAASLMAFTSGLRQLATPNPDNLPKLNLKQPQPRLPGPVALGLWVHEAAKPLCWLAKALWDYTNAGGGKPLVLEQQTWEVTLH